MPSIQRVIDSHTELADLTTGDGHTQYVLLAGRAGGQTVYGDTAANGDLILHGTSDSTRTTSYVLLQPTAGFVGVGTLTPLTRLNVVDTINTSPRGILSTQISTDTNGARVGFAKARGTEGAKTTVVTGDTLGRVMFRGYDGSNYLEMASIEAVSTGTVAATRVPTYLAFSTATDAAPSVLTERMRITQAGYIGIGTDTPKAPLHIGAGTDTPIVAGPTGYFTNQGQTDLVVRDSENHYEGRLTVAAGLIIIGSSSNHPVSFRANNNEKMRLSAAGGLSLGNSYATTDPGAGSMIVSGKIGVGLLSPDSLLHVSNSTTANTNTVQQLLTLSANSTGTAAAGFGSRILWELESSTTDDQAAAALDVLWTTATHASMASTMVWSLVTAATLAEKMRLTGEGNLKLGGTASRAGTVGTNHIDLFDGTAPTSTLTNGVSLYSVAGKLWAMDAAGNATQLTP